MKFSSSPTGHFEGEGGLSCSVPLRGDRIEEKGEVGVSYYLKKGR